MSEDLFTYRVPKLTPDGTCSAGHEFEEQLYDLRPILNVENAEQEKIVFYQLQNLYDLLNEYQNELSANWIGIYQKSSNAEGIDVLVKLAYQGNPSRAEFPLTQSFAALSNNSTVGLTGKPVVIQNVSEHEGAYYKCDGQVNSEACYPILSRDGNEVVGIVDAESFNENHFDGFKLERLEKLCEQLSDLIPIKN